MVKLTNFLTKHGLEEVDSKDVRLYENKNDSDPKTRVRLSHDCEECQEVHTRNIDPKAIGVLIMHGVALFEYEGEKDSGTSGELTAREIEDFLPVTDVEIRDWLNS